MIYLYCEMTRSQRFRAGILLIKVFVALEYCFLFRCLKNLFIVFINKFYKMCEYVFHTERVAFWETSARGKKPLIVSHRFSERFNKKFNQKSRMFPLCLTWRYNIINLPPLFGKLIYNMARLTKRTKVPYPPATRCSWVPLQAVQVLTLSIY